MPDLIKLLPDAIANQIAAGEVVQRPASVIKELMENAVDAGADEVIVVVRDAGKALIQISDNGCGMSETDARMCFERHATSKISRSEDLFAIRTMGFRGEAVASIAAVSQMELKTKLHETDLGTLITVEGSTIKGQEPVACNPGTSLSVKNLFYNVPARRNFLKSNPVEMRHIVDEFQRIALANPEVSFVLSHNDQEMFNLPKSNLGKRIINIFGKSYQEQLVACQEEVPLLKIMGYLGKPEAAKKTRGEQFFFVNNRFIKSPYLHHAVMQAYEGLLGADYHPFYVLDITIDPKHIDINVHPTKTEIKFDDERTVYGIIKAMVKQSLGVYNVTPTLDFDADVNMEIAPNERLRNISGKEAGYRGGGEDTFHPDTMKRKNAQHWQKLFHEEYFRNDERIEDFESGKQAPLKFESSLNRISGEEKETASPQIEGEQKTFQLHYSYIICQVKSGMMVLDQQAVHERILYEKYLGNLEKRDGASQQVLFPPTIELNTADFMVYEELENEIKALGFDVSVIGPKALAINGVPGDANLINEKVLFEEMIEQFKHNSNELKIGKQENLARSLAKRSGIKQGQRLEPHEMRALIDQLFACKTPGYTPGGQITYKMISLRELVTMFN